MNQKLSDLVWQAYQDENLKDFIDMYKDSCDIATILNSQDDNGRTIMHFVVENNEIEIAKLLLENGASLAVENRFCQEPLWVAVFKFNSDKDFLMIKLLLKHGADPTHRIDEGGSPLDLAKVFPRAENLVQLLEQYRKDL